MTQVSRWLIVRTELQDDPGTEKRGGTPETLLR